jgi:hypothetical protein
MKRAREYSIDDQQLHKKKQICCQMINGISNLKKPEPVKLNYINIDATVKDYNVKINDSMGKPTFYCSCSCSPYKHFKVNYCKHITLALLELTKTFLRENENFFEDKKENKIFNENIEILNTNLKNIYINNNI